MKNTLLFLIIIMLIGCRKEGLDVTFRTIYKSSQEKSTSQDESGELLQVHGPGLIQLGDLVGAITPGKVTAKFHSIRFIDQKSTTGGMQTMVEIISTNWSEDDARRFADFSNGNTVEVVPEMWGNIDNDGWFVDDNIRLRYLGIFPQKFTFEFELPSQLEDQELGLYNTLASDMVQREGNTIKCEMHFLLQFIDNAGFDYAHGIYLNGFVFGETDSTYIVRQDNIPGSDIAELISMAQPHSVARSGNYNCPVLTPPPDGKSKTIISTIGFNTENIIQHYAGHDNIAYTSDDMFILAPKFWERFSIEIDQN